MTKVPEQKGPIKVGIPTYRTMKYTDRVTERADELRALRGAQTQTLHEPKPPRK